MKRTAAHEPTQDTPKDVPEVRTVPGTAKEIRAFVDGLTPEELREEFVLLALMRQVAEGKRASAEHLATHDPLTGLLNRRGFVDAMALSLNRNRRTDTGVLALTYIDLDNFKTVNDTQGHAVGDQALINTSRLLVAGLRDGDVIGRLGGDEFAALTVTDTIEDAVKAMSRIGATAREQAADPDIHMTTFSIGVMNATDKLELGVDGLLKSADSAMYTAKQAGRDQLHFLG